ncbi:MAG: hypothetical protein AB4042_18495 [Leptolyngbyaceae cyanobacterium]
MSVINLNTVYRKGDRVVSAICMVSQDFMFSPISGERWGTGVMVAIATVFHSDGWTKDHFVGWVEGTLA